MISGKCPFCDSMTIYANPEALVRASGGILQLVDPYGDLNTYLEPYVCVQCGFVAMFVKEGGLTGDLPSAKGWRQVK